MRAGGRVDELTRARGDAREPLKKIQRRAFADEQRARRPLELADLLGRAATIAVLLSKRDVDGRIELPKGLEGNVEAGKDAVGLDDEDPSRALIGAHRGVGRDVAAADVLLDRAPDDVAVLRRIQTFHPGCHSLHVTAGLRVSTTEDTGDTEERSQFFKVEPPRPQCPRW